jgi:hypothetical protein
MKKFDHVVRMLSEYRDRPSTSVRSYMSFVLSCVVDDDMMDWPGDILPGQQCLHDDNGNEMPLIAQTDWKQYSERVGIDDPPEGVLVIDMPYQLQHDVEDGFLVGFTAVGWEMSDVDDPTMALRNIDPVVLLILFRNLLQHLRREYIQKFIDVAEGTQWLVPPMMLPMIVSTGLSQRYPPDTDMSEPLQGAVDILSEIDPAGGIVSPSSPPPPPPDHHHHHQIPESSSVFTF